MKKTIIILFLFISLLSSFSFAVLVDSFDFEDLYVGTQANNFSKESLNKLNCTSSYPSCVSSVGGGFGFAKATIEQDYIQGKFLTVSAVDGKLGDYKTTNVNLNLNNLTVLNNITLEYMIKINEYRTTDVFAGTLSYNVIGGLWFTNFVVGISPNIMSSMSGGNLYNTNANIFTSIKGEYEGNKFIPENSSCNINNGNWNKITHQYFFNSTEHFLYEKIFKNGILCSYEEYSKSFLPTSNNLLSLIRISAYAGFNISYDDFKLYNELITPYPIITDTTLLTCPVKDCLFFDDFKYEDNYDLSLVNYVYNTEHSYVRNEILYIDSNPSSNFIAHAFKENENTIVDSISKFRFNNTITPSTLGEPNNEYIVYGIETLCNDVTGNTLNNFLVYFIRDDDFTGNENNTIVNLYNIDGGIELKGTVVVSNDEDIYIHTRFNTNTQKTQIKFLTTSTLNFLDSGFISSLDFNSNCYNLGAVNIMRVDRYNTVNLDFVGLDTIYYYGNEPLIDGIEDFEFIYGNKTETNESIIDGDIGEYIHNVATTLGFKSDISKILFWYALIFLLVVGVIQIQGIAESKNLVISLVVIVMHLLGYKLGFLPVVFLIFIFLVMATVLGIIFYKIFGSEGG